MDIKTWIFLTISAHLIKYSQLALELLIRNCNFATFCCSNLLNNILNNLLPSNISQLLACGLIHSRQMHSQEKIVKEFSLSKKF